MDVVEGQLLHGDGRLDRFDQSHIALRNSYRHQYRAYYDSIIGDPPWRSDARLMLENLKMAHDEETTTKSYMPCDCPGANEIYLKVCDVGAAGADMISCE